MNIQCEKCGRQYEVEESYIGQDVECECGHKWQVTNNISSFTEDDLKEIKEKIVFEIWQTVKEIIKLNLKSPASAKFEYENSKDAITYLGDRTFEINSIVDSQNSYGAMIRNFFTVICFYENQRFVPVFWKLDEQFSRHEILPKEIHCLFCQKNFYHDAVFEPATLVCPYCGKETTYIDLSTTGCLKKLLLAIIVIPILILLIIGVFWFFFSIIR
ncbi:MAG: hypothetical protein J5787_01655 [Alphaproteobacteria bacterium]|nr:hypothetical protein [Alphaproteobacteria bacterium]